MKRALLLIVLMAAQPALGWSHQGHMLLTRLAALRIIDDPSAPKGLRDFLAANMNATMADCQALAETEIIGGHPTHFLTPLDEWATLPDRIQSTAAGQRPIEPYGATESKMHFLDLEYFSPRPWYADDLSNKPPLDAFPNDPKDPRYQRAGFVPLRVDECYHRLVSGFAAGNAGAELHWAGYLAHYIEDSHQPHHATEDYKSFTYLAGVVPGVPAVAGEPTAQGRLAQIHIPYAINPHGDIEFQLFADDQPPRDGFRRQFWSDLQADIRDQALHGAPLPARFDAFGWDLTILSDSYDYLPLIGRAAQAAYASGQFDAAAFFMTEGQARGRRMNIIQLIALQNAKAVIHVEQIWRAAWAAAHSP